MSDQPNREPPTLPRPSIWRLTVALVAILAFLVWMYRTGEKEEAASPPGPASESAAPAATPGGR